MCFSAALVRFSLLRYRGARQRTPSTADDFVTRARVRGDVKRQAQRQYSQARAYQKHSGRGNQPQESEDGRQYYGGDVIDRETNSRSRGKVCRIGYFLEIGPDGDRKCKKKVIDDIKACCEAGIIDESVRRKDKSKTDVLEY